MTAQFDMHANALAKECVHIICHYRSRTWNRGRRWPSRIDSALHLMLAPEEQVHGRRVVDVQDAPYLGPPFRHIDGGPSLFKVVDIYHQH